jgi:hypothetical protein
LITEPATNADASGGKMVVIRDMLPLQNVQSAVHGSVLLLKTGSLQFETDQQCEHSKRELELGKWKVCICNKCCMRMARL